MTNASSEGDTYSPLEETIEFVISGMDTKDRQETETIY